MNERTAEEKLRQTLEGGVPDGSRTRRGVRRGGSAREPRVKDSFMEDFEKKIEQSLSVDGSFKTPSRQREKVIAPKPLESEFSVIEAPAPSDELGVRSEELGVEQAQETPPEPIDETPEPVEELGVRSEELGVAEEQATPQEPTPEVEEVPEPEELNEPESVEEDELPDIPLIEDDHHEDEQYFDEEEDEDESNLPDIPVISADEVDDEDEEDDESSETFSPNADIVLNVDEEIPASQEPDPMPEGESVPVSITMPETTKTAEDKLMADIAEAMTGSPPTLETRETPEPYKLPENFLAEAANADPAQQSAEEKLIANIAQAMTESPLDAAAKNINQDFERELDNLDFTPSLYPSREEPLTQEVDLSPYEEDPEPEPQPQPDDEPAKPETEIESTFEESPLPDPIPEPDPEPAEELDELGGRSEEVGADEDTPEPTNEVAEPELSEELGVRSEELGVEEILPEPVEEIVEPTPEPEPEPPAVEEQDEQEHAEVIQEQNMPEESLLNEEDSFENEITELSPESDFEDSGEDFDISSLGELSAAASLPDYDEPLEDVTPPPIEPEPELEPKAEQYEYNNVVESGYGNDYEYEESETPPLNVRVDPGEEEDKEKIMGIREKIAGRKGNMAKDSSDGTKKKKLSPSMSGGLLMPLLLMLLLAVGGFIAWQLMQLNDRLAMNAGMSGAAYESGSVETNPSYEYAIDFIFDTNLSGRMSQRGRDGWQVVGSRRTQDSITGQLGYEFIFMRKTPVK